MSSRPTTARPKTSAGRRVSSARLLRKPSSFTNITQNAVTVEQPLSRTAMVPESTVRQIATASQPTNRIDSISRAQQISTTSNEKIRNRMDTGQGVRLLTSVNQAAPRGTAMRPVTQQGLTGVKPPTRPGAGRFVVDKSYYMSLLRAQMNNLLNEIDRLRGELSKGERDRQNLLIYEKKAEEEAHAIRTLQERLMDYNKIMDLINTNSELHEIENELVKLHEERSEAERSLAELIEERHMKDENIRKIENEIEEQKAQNSAKFHSMNPAIFDTYEELKKENIQLLEKCQEKQAELEELNQTKEQLNEHLAKFPLKQQAIILYERLAELEKKKCTIADEIKAEGTPDEQRERLLQTVTRTTEEINVIQKQLDDANEQIKQLTEELREFDIEMENVAGEKDEKYRELKLKEMEIDEFLNSYDNLRAGEESKIDEISAEVVRMLELISINLTNLSVNSQDVNLNHTELNMDGDVSASALQELYVRLQEELLEMNELEEHLKMDNNQINDRINELNVKMESFENVDDLKDHKEKKRQELENRHKILAEELPKVNATYQKLIDELERTKSALERNDSYIKLKNAEKRWREAEKNLHSLREAAIQREEETNYEVLKNEALRLKAAYNELLIESTKFC